MRVPVCNEKYNNYVAQAKFIDYIITTTNSPLHKYNSIFDIVQISFNIVLLFTISVIRRLDIKIKSVVLQITFEENVLKSLLKKFHTDIVSNFNKLLKKDGFVINFVKLINKRMAGIKRVWHLASILKIVTSFAFIIRRLALKTFTMSKQSRGKRKQQTSDENCGQKWTDFEQKRLKQLLANGSVKFTDSSATVKDVDEIFDNLSNNVIGYHLGQLRKKKCTRFRKF